MRDSYSLYIVVAVVYQQTDDYQYYCYSSIDTFKASELDFDQHQAPAFTNTTARTAQEDEQQLSKGPKVTQDVEFDGRLLDIHRSDKSPPIKPLATNSNKKTSKPLASKSPTFKPYGISASLTSSNDNIDNDNNNIDDFNSTSNISSTLNSHPTLQSLSLMKQ
ncbi:hypothetical protein BY996DRAFT_6481704 [Phakopsora pachyrhizi]|uniref:Uncharacterized protein n=1 Tax=Phakopsora pachyrhizi TaxID=170000 RepID=A0AAV0B0I7_PHAPC|nr:hypothetical protein BY996DRAFT_6481704 [Phakopsora pachyrhizi]CAH7676463.1 hypothetical protein PPACK8108_LOCUS11606 [Phakopsora pachyrhizi]